MTILHLLGSRSEGGAETYFLDLVAALQAEGADQAAAIRPHPHREAVLAEAATPLVTAPFGGPFDLVTAPRLRRFAAEEEAEVQVAWMNRAARFTPRGRPRVGRLGGYYDLKYYRGFDHLVANTEDIGRWIVREGWAAERVSVIPNFAEPQGDAPPTPRASLSTPEGVPLLLAMSRLHPAKGLDVLLRAMPRLPEAWLWVAGVGPLRSELEAQAAELGIAGRTRFLGWRADASALYRAADLVVFPSRFEPLGNTVIQAWAHGAPALAAAVLRVLAEPGLAERLMQAGRARVASGFSRDAVLARWRELFAGLAR